MTVLSSLDHHAEQAHENRDAHARERAFAARLDMTIKRSRLSSSRVAKSLGVAEGDVALWRAGITMPRASDYRRLSDLLHVDVQWLRSGSTQ
jgi:transcriptional regulator with XRE-family HTH domain